MIKVLCFCILLKLVTQAVANTEKTVFVAPHSTLFASSDLATLCLPVISPIRPSLRTELSLLPIGKEVVHDRRIPSWYILHQLNLGQRYEIRLCWAANQPTEFWLDTLTVAETFDSPDLLSELAAYSAQLQDSACPEHLNALTNSQSLLFLRVRAAADFFTINKTLMNHPPSVGLDVILDPYLSNILPRSLASTVAFIAFVACGAWILSGMVWRWLESFSEAIDIKPHVE